LIHSKIAFTAATQLLYRFGLIPSCHIFLNVLNIVYVDLMLIIDLLVFYF